jgi:hypothetical protein
MALDIEKFVKHLKDNALPGFGQGKCAKFVRKALEAGGAYVTPNTQSAKDYGPILLQIGFREIEVKDPDSFRFVKGDVMVMQPYTNGNINGHVAGYNGSKWISDFVQTDFWAGPGYRAERPAYVVYRY